MGNGSEYAQDKAHAIASETLIAWKRFKNRCILVTGGTGLIGSQVVRTLLVADKIHSLGLHVLLPVRDVGKARKMFGDESVIEPFTWYMGKPLPDGVCFDFAIHGASATASADFKEKPVEIMLDAVAASEAVLSAAHICHSERSVFLSSMEIYGEVEGVATEENLGRLETMSARNSYPQAKRFCEGLFASFFFEYGLSTSVVRLAQTFGEGVAKDDGRVFAEFGRCAVDGQDIKLVTNGLKRNSYVSVDDAVRAILIVLLKGEGGKAYNVANESTYCSIREMAEMVLREFGVPEARVLFEADSVRAAQFRASTDLKLDASRVKALGWQPRDGLLSMYKSMLEGWSEDNER